MVNQRRLSIRNDLTNYEYFMAQTIIGESSWPPPISQPLALQERHNLKGCTTAASRSSWGNRGGKLKSDLKQRNMFPFLFTVLYLTMTTSQISKKSWWPFRKTRTRVKHHRYSSCTNLTHQSSIRNCSLAISGHHNPHYSDTPKWRISKRLQKVRKSQTCFSATVHQVQVELSSVPAL